MVYKATLIPKQENEEDEPEPLIVALKELRGEAATDTFYEFQHEVSIMRFVV